MSFQPVLPPLLLAAVAAAIILARLLVFRSMPPWRWAGVTLAALLLLCAAARPVLGTEDGVTRTVGGSDPNVFLLVDRSAGMGVEDAGDGRSRMAAARNDIAAVLDRYPGARVAVIAFAARPSVDWPLSADVWSLRPVLAALTPYASTPDDVYQANAAAAGNTLRYQLIGAVQQYPQARNLVFYFGAGAGDSRSPPRQFNLPEGAVDGGAVLGYGTAGADSTPIDERALRTVADEIGVPYVPRDGGTELDEAVPDADPGTDAEAAAPTSVPRTESYWIFAFGAAALLLVELYLVLREFRRSRLAVADVIG